MLTWGFVLVLFPHSHPPTSSLKIAVAQATPFSSRLPVPDFQRFFYISVFECVMDLVLLSIDIQLLSEIVEILIFATTQSEIRLVSVEFRVAGGVVAH